MMAMDDTAVLDQPLAQRARAFYLKCLRVLDEAHLGYLVGGGYAMRHYTGIVRDTKDLDVFVRPGESRLAVDALAKAGFRTEWTWPHFLAKATEEPSFVDVLFNSGNGLSPVDDEWFANASPGEMFGHGVLYMPPEEMLWTKAFVMERDRFDGADIAHLILCRGKQFDWERLLRRFVGHERILLAHLMLFGYIYPTQKDLVPGWVCDEAAGRIHDEPPVVEKICRGTYLAQHQYQIDIHQWGYIDGRKLPHGPLRVDDLARFAPPDSPPIK
jgi:hypothetical protein